MNILYITFIDFHKAGSGSTVRPHKMYDAFKALGHEVKLLECQQNKRALRKQRVQEVLDWLSDHTPDLCYIEPPTGPFFNRIDLTLLKRVAKKNIPIALFYRDVFWKFHEHWEVGTLKKKVLIHMHKRDLRWFERYCNKVYFPSESVKVLFDGSRLREMDLLPPGCTIVQNEQRPKLPECIYVGGVSEAYGANLLLAAFDRLNGEEEKVHLNLVTSKDDAQNIEERFLGKPWLSLHHAHGDKELRKIYERANLAIIPFKKTRYMNLAIPIKLFEYVGYGLPMIATDCVEIEKLINKEKIGITCNDTPDDIALAVEQFYQDKDLQDRLYANVEAFAKKNKWEDRAQCVIDDL
ncbi:MAG: glycosyltransferase, partial [Anaerovoracaceae bacterium]